MRCGEAGRDGTVTWQPRPIPTIWPPRAGLRPSTLRRRPHPPCPLLLKEFLFVAVPSATPHDRLLVPVNRLVHASAASRFRGLAGRCSSGETRAATVQGPTVMTWGFLTSRRVGTTTRGSVLGLSASRLTACRHVSVCSWLWGWVGSGVAWSGPPFWAGRSCW